MLDSDLSRLGRGDRHLDAQKKRVLALGLLMRFQETGCLLLFKSERFIPFSSVFFLVLLAKAFLFLVDLAHSLNLSSVTLRHLLWHIIFNYLLEIVVSPINWSHRALKKGNPVLRFENSYTFEFGSLGRVFAVDIRGKSTLIDLLLLAFLLFEKSKPCSLRHSVAGQWSLVLIRLLILNEVYSSTFTARLSQLHLLLEVP